MHRTLKLVFAVCSALSITACGSPAQVAGNYTINTTNKDNPCNFQNWMVGATNNAIPITITQSGSDVTATMTGVAAAFFSGVLGSATFTGTVHESTVDLKLFGTKQGKMNNCSFTINAELIGTVNGDLIEGTVSFTPATNGSPDCGVLASCTNTVDFNGTRPPQ